MINFSLNNHIKVKVNPVGRTYLRSKHLEFSRLRGVDPALKFKYEMREEDKNGYSEWELWDFMWTFEEAFGHPTLRPPVDPDIFLLSGKEVINFNLNDRIKVKITNNGKDYLNHKFVIWRKMFNHPQPEYTMNDEDENGYSLWQLWDFVGTFGGAAKCPMFGSVVEPDVLLTTELVGIIKPHGAN